VITLPGIDVSSYQGAPGRWMPLAGKISWAGVKVSELSSAGSYVDPDALADLAALKAAGHGRLPYLFGHPAMSAQRTVDLFLSALGSALDGDDGVALDLEVTDGLSPAAVAGWAAQVATLLERETGRKPVVYTFRDFALAGYCAGLGHLPLWIADPDSPAGKPGVPAPWTSWAIHQYTDSPLDRDVAAYPSLAAMRAALGKPAPEPKLPVWKDHEPMLMKPGAGSITPVALPSGAKKIVLTPEDTATVGVQTHDHGTLQVDLEWQPPGGKVVEIPGGVQFVHLHRIDGGKGDVSYTWE
jgi:hypothetical protein